MMDDMRTLVFVLEPERGNIALIRFNAADVAMHGDIDAQIAAIINQIHERYSSLELDRADVRDQIRAALNQPLSNLLPGYAYIIHIPGEITLSPDTGKLALQELRQQLDFMRQQLDAAHEREIRLREEWQSLLRQLEQTQAESYFMRDTAKGAEQRLRESESQLRSLQSEIAELQSLLRRRDDRGTDQRNRRSTAQDVRFTSFLPAAVEPQRWYSLLVYAHDADVLRQVQANAANFADEMGGKSREISSDEPVQLAQDSEFTIRPEGPSAAGVEFEPQEVTLRWRDLWQRGSFRFRIGRFIRARAVPITINVKVGPLIVATLLARVEPAQPKSASRPQPVETTAKLYQRIFTSYSHADTDVVFACRAAYKALGLDVMIDVDTLRPGTHWNAELMRMIETADIFQLFWSKNAAKSYYVRREWEHALKHYKGEGFIRPVYWETPMEPAPRKLKHIHFTYQSLPTFHVPTSIVAYANAAS